MDSKVYWRFVAISGAHLFAVQLVLPVLAPYFSSLGYSDAWISLIFGVFPLVMVPAAILLGELSDEVGRSWVIKAAFLVSALAYASYLIGASWSIVVARVLDAASYTALSVILFAKIQDSLEERERGRRTGIMLSVTTALRMLGPLVGGVLADRYIGLPFGATILIMLALAFTMRKGHLHKKREHIRVNPWRSVQWFFANKQLRPMLLLGPFMHLLQPGLVVFLPLLVVNSLGLSYTQAGIATMVYSVGSLLQFFYGDLADRLGSRRLVVLGTAVKSCAFILIAAYGHTFLALLGLLALFSLGSGLWNVAAWKHMSRIAEEEGMEGRVVGTYMSVAKVGELASFAGAGAIVAVMGYHGVFFVLGVLGFVGVVAGAALFYVGWLTQRSRSASVA